MSQTNNACPIYYCGKLLAERLNTKDKDLSNYIYLYNKWAEQNGKSLIDDAELAKLDGAKKEELLNTYALRLSHYMHSTMRLERIANAEDISQWEEAIDSGYYDNLIDLLDAYSYFDTLADETRNILHMTPDQLSHFVDSNEDEILELIS